ncbi:ribose ABC transporter permease [Synergistales bacterium]|nr:ribose ABC transporter permease [Synergistales bacterium]
MNLSLKKFRYYTPEFFALIALCVLCALLEWYSVAVFEKNFVSYDNLVINVARQVSLNAIIACGMAFAILSGGIDLSVGAIVAFSGVITASLVKNHPVAPGWTGYGVAIAAGIAIGLLCGLANGLIVAYTKIPPFVATFATMSVARGSAYVFTNGTPISGLPAAFNEVGKGYWNVSAALRVPIPVILCLVVFVFCWFLLVRTRFGRYACAIGNNVDTVRLAGINVRKIYIQIYMLVGFVSGISGVAQCGRLASGQPTAGINWELDAIASVVIGGGNIAGGRVTIFGTLIGALIIGVINTGLNMLGMLYYNQLIVKGFVVIIAVLLRSGLNRES